MYDQETHTVLAPSENLYTFEADEAIIITDTNDFLKEFN